MDQHGGPSYREYGSLLDYVSATLCLLSYKLPIPSVLFYDMTSLWILHEHVKVAIIPTSMDQHRRQSDSEHMAPSLTNISSRSMPIVTYTFPTMRIILSNTSC
jgi:hypothetical protein